MKKSKIFLSWSGVKSKKLGNSLKNIINDVYGNNVDLYISTTIPIGIEWFKSIKKELEKADLGILILTDENINSPWQIFEAGVLFANVPIIPILFGRDIRELESPLRKIQALKEFNKENLKLLLSEIKKYFKVNISDDVLSTYIDSNWEKGKKYQKSFRYSPTTQSPNTTLTINSLKRSAYFFIEQYGPLLKDADLIVGVNFAGSIIAPILAHSCNKKISYLWLRQSNSKTKIARKSCAKKMNKIKEILIVDGKYKSGDGLTAVIRGLQKKYKNLEKITIFISLTYWDKHKHTKKKIEKKIEKKIKEKSKYKKITISFRLHKFTIAKKKGGKYFDTIKEELDPYKS